MFPLEGQRSAQEGFPPPAQVCEVTEARIGRGLWDFVVLRPIHT